MYFKIDFIHILEAKFADIIQYVREHRVLWDPTVDGYLKYNQDVVNVHRLELFLPLAIKYNVSAAEIEHRVQLLRKFYIRYSREGKLDRYAYLKGMSFLDNFIDRRERHAASTNSNQNMSMEDNDQSITMVYEPQITLSDSEDEDNNTIDSFHLHVDSGFSWSEEDEVELLEFYKNHPELWHPKHPNYVPLLSSRVKKELRYRRLAAIVPLAEKLSTSATTCEHRFCVMRSIYLKKSREKKVCEHYGRLKFLDEVIVRRGPYTSREQRDNDGFQGHNFVFSNSSNFHQGYPMNALKDDHNGSESEQDSRGQWWYNQDGGADGDLPAQPKKMSGLDDTRRHYYRTQLEYILAELRKMESKKAQYCFDRMMLAHFSSKLGKG